MNAIEVGTRRPELGSFSPVSAFHHLKGSMPRSGLPLVGDVFDDRDALEIAVLRVSREFCVIARIPLFPLPNTWHYTQSISGDHSYTMSRISVCAVVLPPACHSLLVVPGFGTNWNRTDAL